MKHSSGNMISPDAPRNQAPSKPSGTWFSVVFLSQEAPQERAGSISTGFDDTPCEPQEAPPDTPRNHVPRKASGNMASPRPPREIAFPERFPGTWFPSFHHTLPKRLPVKSQEASPDTPWNHVPPSARGFSRELWERPKQATTGRPDGERQPTFRRPGPTPRRLSEAFQRLPRRPVRPEEAPKKFQEAPKGPQASPKRRPQASHKIMFPDGLREHDS